MLSNIVPTWIVGRRSLLVEGIIASVEQSFFRVKECCEKISELDRNLSPTGEHHLYIYVVERAGLSLEKISSELADLRLLRPNAFIVCVASDFYVDDEPLIAAGANGCFSGHFTGKELNLLLSFILSGDSGVSVVVAPRALAVDRPRVTFRSPVEDALRSAEEEEEAARELIIEDGFKPQSAFALSRREREVLAGLVNGHSNKALARRLLISEATVKAHVRTVFRKLGAHSRTQAVRNLLQHCPPGSSLDEWLMILGTETPNPSLS